MCACTGARSASVSKTAIKNCCDSLNYYTENGEWRTILGINGEKERVLVWGDNATYWYDQLTNLLKKDYEGAKDKHKCIDRWLTIPEFRRALDQDYDGFCDERFADMPESEFDYMWDKYRAYKAYEKNQTNKGHIWPDRSCGHR